jgi:hypothetical protein
MIELTESGQYLIDYIFSRIELLYYCALDTPLPSSLITQGLISAHNNDPNSKVFARNCINTSTTFIEFMCYYHEKELNQLKEKNVDASLLKYFMNPFENFYISAKLNNRILELKKLI